jgi:anion-transporting  ArsA/GET3 family ATPase
MNVELISGKGGVGKSVVTAAKARIAARSGKRVLALSMLPGGGLGAHLGLDEVQALPTVGVDGVSVAEIRRPDALEQYLRLNSPIPIVVGLGKAVTFFDALATTAPGVREIITIGKVIHEAESGQWDAVVVDCAPTGQFASYLNAPDTISQLVPSGRIRKQADKIRDFLTDHARITYVSLPEELPVVETLAAIAEEVPGELNPVIFNRLLSPLSVPVPSGESALARAAQLQNAIVRQQAHWIAQLPNSLYLPFLLGASGPMEVSDLLTGVLEAAT